MTSTPLVCPRCGDGTRLFSDEAASILYPVTFVLTPATEDEPQMEYTGESYDVMDEGTVSRDQIWCRSCTWSGGMASLLTVRQAAHQLTPIDEMRGVDEDSTRGADVRWQGVCYAALDGWACDWAGLWHHADTFDTDVDGDERDPGARAYDAAEVDINEHLRTEGVHIVEAAP